MCDIPIVYPFHVMRIVCSHCDGVCRATQYTLTQ